MRLRAYVQVLALACCAAACQSQPSQSSPPSSKQTASQPPLSKQSSPPTPSKQTPPSPPPSDHSENVGPVTSKEAYAGPPVKVQLLQLQTYPPQNQVNIEIVAPTGGWSLELDEGDVVGGVAKIFLTLERPAANEMVTQALVTHTKSFITTEPFTAAQAYVHLAQRGVQTLTTDYRLAASAK
ncbi:MAG: protease complex subunit PrcB family protein [Phycisphaerales bacterium]|nr:protease complex subunit PrcB family protein [Phycisphaerales bacterium]MCI0675453.1 protease complex subunit PrcB family protein [Phycisphaerales bacterium]